MLHNSIKLIILISFGFYTSCDKELKSVNTIDEPNTTNDTIYFNVEGISVSNGIIRSISYNSASVVGDFASLAPVSHPIEEHGYVWDQDRNNLNITSAKGFSSLGPKLNVGAFVTVMKNLLAGTTYFVTSYVESKGKISYHSHPLSFTTLKGEGPSFSMSATSNNLTHETATIINTIADMRDTILIDYGHIWSETNADVNLLNCSNNKSSKGKQKIGENHIFSSTLNNLKPSKTYYFKAFAINQFDTAYSQVFSFTTLDLPAPILEIKDVKYIESNRNGTINPGELIEVLINVGNTGNAIAENVEVELEKNRSFTFKSTNPIAIGKILSNEEKEVKIAIEIENNVAWETEIKINAILRSDSKQWTNSTSIFFIVKSPYVVSNGLVKYLPFNECNGNTTKSVVNNSEAFFFGATFSSDVIIGSSGCALEFKSTEKDYIQFPENPMNGLSTISVSFWLKSYSGNGTIFSTKSYYRLYLENNKFASDNLRLEMPEFNLATFLSGNVWNHFVIVQNDNKKAKLYINGKLMDSRDYYFFPSNSGDGFYLGRGYSGNESYFNGKIDNFRLYNRPISETEVQEIYNAKQ